MFIVLLLFLYNYPFYIFLLRQWLQLQVSELFFDVLCFIGFSVLKQQQRIVEPWIYVEQFSKQRHRWVNRCMNRLGDERMDEFKVLMEVIGLMMDEWLDG
ncbi:hypothetical protein ATANTOWER_009063 [Ataeniobius toweri]|uniref:Uncharacterized protein n=1 Tax=Ataeniobius toweri TaxID=208326 RepID=A0ABU7BXJ2_9TELE|nr:hypothetical protein [Ataeniobius toweri]